MKKIIIINDCLTGGGVERVLRETALFLSSKGYYVVVAAQATYRSAQKVLGDNIAFIPISTPSGKFPTWSIKWFFDRFFSKLYSIFFHLWKQFHYFDYAVAFKEGQSMIEVLKIKARRKIGWVHTDFRFFHWTEKLFFSPEAELQCMSKYDKIVCVSHAVKDGVIQIVGNPDNLVVCYNPIDYMSILNEAEDMCPLKKPDNRILFVSVGRLDTHKNYPLLIEACAKLEKKYNFETWIIGAGKERERLEALIKENKVHSVKLLGAFDNPFPYLKLADCYLCTSISESYGLSIQESLILGVPVISTNCPGIIESLDTQFGIITENSLSGMETAMEKVLRNPEVLNEYRKKIQSSFQIKNLFQDRLDCIYSLFS